jgi:hypothetical protein
MADARLQLGEDRGYAHRARELSALSPWPMVVRLLTGLGWVVGLGAIVLLWQRSSTAFIKARFPR